MNSLTGRRRLVSSRLRSGPRWAVVVVFACLLASVLASPAEAHKGAHGEPAVEAGGSGGDAAGLAVLADAQEALLNAYRCMFDVDAEVVPGGCVNGASAAGPSEPGAVGAVDTAALRRLVVDQEALLNAYRCMFAVDVEVVPGGCSHGRPTAEPVAGNEESSDGSAGDEAAGAGDEEPVDCSGAEHCLVSLSGRSRVGRWCGLRADQTVICTSPDGFAPLSWGSQGPVEGQLRSVSAGLNYACGVGVEQAVRCWSYNWLFEPAGSPAGRFLSVSAGIAFTEFACGIREDQTAVCWGDQSLFGIQRRKLDAPSGRFLSVSAGWQHACGIREGQTVVCWGDNTHGRLDAPDGRFLEVSAGFWFSCGIREDNTATCWGNNLRRGYNAPDGRFLEVSAGQSLACGLREDQTVVCWGPSTAGTYGELDPPEGQFHSISAGASAACGLRLGGTIECWGDVAATTWPNSTSSSVFKCSWCSDPTKTTGEFDVHVFYCARAGKFAQADLEYETNRMNEIVGAFWARESSGLADVRFVPGGIATHDLDWDNATINSLYAALTDPQKPDPCAQSVEEQDPGRRYQHILLLADISPGERSGDCPGACATYPVLMPTIEALYASKYICPSHKPPRLVHELPGRRNAPAGKETLFGNIRASHNTSCRDLAYWVYDYLVAHELGHDLFGFGHPPDCSIMSGNPWACPPIRVQNMDDTLRNPNLLQTAYIGCAERRLAGWPQDPNRCPKSQ